MVKEQKKVISQNLLSEIKEALESVKYGSIEIFVQNKVVTQITVRNIHKTSVEIESESNNFQSNVYIRKSAVKTD
jgi:hypothetical protein